MITDNASMTPSVTKYSIHSLNSRKSTALSTASTSQLQRNAIWLVMCFGIVLLSAGIIALAITNLLQELSDAEDYNWVGERRGMVTDILVYSHELQNERSTTSYYLAAVNNSAQQRDARNTLDAQRNVTNAATVQVAKFWSVMEKDLSGDVLYEEARTAFNNLTAFRDVIDRKLLSSEDSMTYYNYMIAKHQNILMMMATLISVSSLKNRFSDLYRFATVKDYLSQVEAVCTLLIVRPTTPKSTLTRVSSIVNNFENAETTYLDLATQDLRDSYGRTLQGKPEYDSVMTMVYNLMALSKNDTRYPNETYWTATISSMLDQYLIESRRIVSLTSGLIDQEVVTEDEQLTGTIIILIVCVAVTAAIECTIIMLMVRARRAEARIKEQERTIRTRTRKVSLAPRAKEVAMMFTDVQQSTKLWTALGSTMESGVALHHKVLRRAIMEHGGYEVKTIGDAFMVAHSDPVALCRIAIDAQRGLLEADWPDEMFDEEDAKIVYDPEDRDTVIFRGLRVRMGIHYGPVEVMYDDVSKGYDYYGDTVNCSSRVEHNAIGGQIIVSQALMDQLGTTPAKDLACSIKEIGLRQLKGIAEPQQLFSIVPNGLEARETHFAQENLRNNAAKVDIRDLNDKILKEGDVEGMSEDVLRHVVRALRSQLDNQSHNLSDSSNPTSPNGMVGGTAWNDAGDTVNSHHMLLHQEI